MPRGCRFKKRSKWSPAADPKSKGQALFAGRTV
jgi:hypothetical protein